jgi:Plasmid pRiA4b ORF-3-like protein
MPDIARLKISLDEVEPEVLRRVEAPLAIRLDDLHLAIQIAMGWENYHLYEFRIAGIAWGIPDPDVPGSDDPLPAAKATLADLVERARTKTFQYLYDFGDGWEHTIRIEALTQAEPALIYPRLLAAQGRCPPEDVGGPWGYVDYLEAIADPNHERHAELLDWRGPGFDPNFVDANAIQIELDRLAKRLARHKAKPQRKACR